MSKCSDGDKKKKPGICSGKKKNLLVIRNLVMGGRNKKAVEYIDNLLGDEADGLPKFGVSG